MERVGKVIYRLALPPKLSGIYNVFHLSILRKYIRDLTHVIDYQDIEVNDNVSFDGRPIQILNRRLKKLRSKEILLVKTQ